MVKLNPVIDRVAKAKGVDLVFNAAESGLVWAAPGMDLTLEVITSLDGPGAAAKPAAGAPATPPATPPAAGAPANAAAARLRHQRRRPLLGPRHQRLRPRPHAERRAGQFGDPGSLG